MKEKNDLINKIQKYLKENKKDGLLIFEVDHLEPYFDEITGAPSSLPALLYIPAEEKPKCVVSNLEINAIRSTGLFKEENITEYKTEFKTATEDLFNSLKGKNILVNFSEENPLVDQIPHSFFKDYLKGINVESSENLWKSIGLKIKEKEYTFTTSLEVRKARVKEFTRKLSMNQGFLMVNGTGKGASETYACYLFGFLKNNKYAIAIKPGNATAIIHKDESLNEHPFDEIITYKSIEEFQKIISGYFKDVEDVHYNEEMTEGNYRLVKKTLDKKLKSINLVKELLSVKLPEEVKEMEKACRINDAIFDYLEKKLKVGLSEKEVSELIKKKALTYSEVFELFFPPLVAAGENGASVHHLTSDYKIQKGDLLLVDIGVRLKTGMGSDTTCMYYFGDSIPERIKKYDEVMDKAIISAVKKIGPGKPKIDADLAARAEITKHYPFFYHGTGHGVDIKCHGSSERITSQPTGFFGTGEVFTAEPGIYISKEQVSKKYPRVEGFRKEIMVAVTKDGVKIISEIPKLRLIKG